MKPTVSVVIPTYNRPNLALKHAAIIRKFYKDIQIIIVDQENNSKINEKEIKKLHIEYINLDQANTSHAKNIGVEHATGDIVFFFDDDVEITPETITAQLTAYENPDVVGTAGRVINDGEKVPSNADVATGKTNFLATKFIQQFWSKRPQNVDFPYGCNMSFRRDIIKKVGGFDESFPKIFEEIDLGKRVQKYGTMRFVPAGLAYHHKAASGGTRSSIKDKMSLIYRTYGYYMAKRVIFPLSLITLFLRTRSARKEAPHAVKELYQGYWEYFKKLITWENFLLLSFFILIIVLRLWKVPQWFSFNFDEEYQASLAWEQVKNFHVIWIGVNAANIGYYLGPGFTYLNYILFKISHGDPAILAWYSALFGLVTTASVYYITNNLFTRRAAVVASVVYGGSAFINFFDRRFWNPSPMPFIAIWLIYSIVKAQRNPRWYILSTILFASTFHTNLSLLILAPILFLAIIHNFKKIKLHTWIPMIVSYIIITFPLMVFDVVHHFDNLLAPYRLIFGKHQEAATKIDSSSIILHTQVLINALGKIWFLKIPDALQNEQCLGQHCIITQANPILIIFSLYILFILVSFFKKGREYSYVIAGILMYCFGFMFYPGYAAEYYLIGLYALFTIGIGVVLSRYSRATIYILLTVFLIANALVIFTSPQEKYGLTTRKKLIQETMRYVGDKPYALENYGQDPRKYHGYGGWRFLFKIYARNPSTSFADEFFGWIFPDELQQPTPVLKVVVTDDKPLQTNQKALVTYQEGVYRSYVFPYEK